MVAVLVLEKVTLSPQFRRTILDGCMEMHSVALKHTSLHSMLKKAPLLGIPVVVQRVTNLTNIHEDVGLIPALALWVKDPLLS